MKKKSFIAITNQADSSVLDLYFLDEIRDQYDFWTDSTYTQIQQVIDKVNYYKPSKIKITIDSVGGDAQAGLSIYNFLKNYNAKVEVEIIGLAASIAVIIACAANPGKLKIAKNGFMMIHKAAGVVAGTADEIRQGADLVEKYTNQCADVIAQRTGKTVDEISSLWANGDYWMTGDEAVAQGFADSIFNAESQVISIAARLDPVLYTNIPDEIRAKMKPVNSQEDPENTQNFFQTIQTDMKKFFTEVINSLKGIKPSDNADMSITNQIAEAITVPFERIGEEMETQITNKVTERFDAAKPAQDEAIGVQVTNAMTAQMDLSNPESAVSKVVASAVKVAVDAAVAAAVEPLNAKIETLEKEVEKEITNAKGGESKDTSNKAESRVVGGFRKG